MKREIDTEFNSGCTKIVTSSYKIYSDLPIHQNSGNRKTPGPIENARCMMATRSAMPNFLIKLLSSSSILRDIRTLDNLS